MVQSQETYLQNDLSMLLFAERAEMHLQQNLRFLNAQNDAVLDQEIQQQILEDQDLELEVDCNANACLPEVAWKAECENPCQLRQLQLQTELLSQQLQLEELDLTLEAVMVANEDISMHKHGKAFCYHAGHRVQSRLLPLARRLQVLVPYVPDLEKFNAEDDSPLVGGLGAKCGPCFHHLRIQLGAIIYELSESVYMLEMQQMDVDLDFQQLEIQFSKQDLKLRSAYDQIERLIVKLDSTRMKIQVASENTASARNETDKSLDIQISKGFMNCLFHEIGLPEWKIFDQVENVAHAASAA